MHKFPITGQPRLRIAVPAGSVTVTAVDGATETTVELTAIQHGHDAGDRVLDSARVYADGDTVVVEVPGDRGLFRNRVPAVRCVVTTASSAVLDVRVASADVEVRGQVGDARISTASGDVRLEQAAGRLEVATASGDVRADRVAGDLSVTTASGDLEVGEVRGDVTAKSASGDVRVGHVYGSVRHSSASGDLTLDTASGGSVTAQTMSGDVAVGVESGVTAWLDLSAVSGRVSSDLPITDDRPEGSGDPLTLRVRTVSGDIRVRRATAAAV
jgi:DUF4097 and DUF4098 domain-containing protein YvlB